MLLYLAHEGQVGKDHSEEEHRLRVENGLHGCREFLLEKSGQDCGCHNVNRGKGERPFQTIDHRIQDTIPLQARERNRALSIWQTQPFKPF
jgi:hypothetical protein